MARSTGSRRAGAVLLATLALVAAWWVVGRKREFDLPSRLVLEEPIVDLGATFVPAAVVAEDGQAPVHPGDLHPGEQIRGNGRRTSLITPPRSRLRFRVAVPADAVLRFGVGVAGDRRRTADRSAVRFTVEVDGAGVYARSVNPAATRNDRRWFDDEVDLRVWAGRTVEVTLGTDAETPGAALPGTPGWSRILVVQRTTRTRQPASAGAPNVLVLLVDTMRADRLGCYGAVPSPSPTLDRLAEAGTVFEHTTSQASWTLPSVGSIMSGLHPRHHGAMHAGKGFSDAPGGQEFLRDEIVTWAERAAHAGITTVGVSSNPLASRATNMAQGFETFVDMPWDASGRRWSSATDVNDVFLRWLARNRARRFVGYLHYMEPHDPYDPPTRHRPAPPPGVRPFLLTGWIRGAVREINWKGAPPLPAAELDYARRLYDAEIHAWDDALAGLLDGVGRLGVRDSTLVVVTADHGEEFLEHGHLTHGSHLYQESVHVPLVLAGPRIARERRPDDAQGIDLYPTLTAFLGLEGAPELPGRDLLATRTGGPIISETGRGIGPDGGAVRLVSVRRGGWTLIRTPTLERFELYDLAEDPGEHDDRWGRAPEGETLAALIADWRPADAPARAAVAPDPAIHDRLQALGYVE